MTQTKVCDGGTGGITVKGISNSKIWKCDEHGFICPFDNWQFTTIDELENHLHKQYAIEGTYSQLCRGVWDFGHSAVEDALFEIWVFKNLKVKIPA